MSAVSSFADLPDVTSVLPKLQPPWLSLNSPSAIASVMPQTLSTCWSHPCHTTSTWRAPFTLRSQLKCPFRQASFGNLIKILILFPTKCHCSQTQNAFFPSEYLRITFSCNRVHFGKQKPYQFVLKWRTECTALIKKQTKKSINRLKRQKEAIEVPER